MKKKSGKKKSNPTDPKTWTRKQLLENYEVVSEEADEIEERWKHMGDRRFAAAMILQALKDWIDSRYRPTQDESGVKNWLRSDMFRWCCETLDVDHRKWRLKFFRIKQRGNPTHILKTMRDDLVTGAIIRGRRVGEICQAYNLDRSVLSAIATTNDLTVTPDPTPIEQSEIRDAIMPEIFDRRTWTYRRVG